jgi:xylan 1,4-beta-xylosidase
MLFEIRRLLRVIGEFDEYRDLPAIVDECDAGVPAHYSVYDNANFQFQNTEYYPVFQVKIMKKILDLNELEDVQVQQATSWSFYFEGERFFEGTRSFLTAGGVEKPFLNAYRALARLGERRVEATSDAAHAVTLLDEAHGRSMPEEIDALASRSSSGTVAVLVWRHTDDQYQRDESDADVTVQVAGLDAGAYTLSHFRIDADHSNSHTAWVAQGSPQLPTDEQVAAIKARQGLEELEPARQVEASGSSLELAVTLPLPAVSLLVLEPVR